MQPSNRLAKKKRGKGRQLEAITEVVPTQTEAPYIDDTGIAVEVTTPEANEVSTDTNLPENEGEVDDRDREDDEYEPEGSGEDGQEGSSTTAEEGNLKSYIHTLRYHILSFNEK